MTTKTLEVGNKVKILRTVQGDIKAKHRGCFGVILAITKYPLEGVQCQVKFGSMLCVWFKEDEIEKQP